MFDADPVTPKKAHPRHPIFGLCLLWPNGWIGEDASWYGSRYRPRPHYVRRAPSSPRERGTAAPSFRPMSIVATVAHLSYCWALVFSERELTFTFAICYRPSVCRLSVVCLSVCLSVVGNTRAPYSGGSNFPQYFYGIWFLGHPLTSTENFTEIVPGEPLRRAS